MRAWTRSLARIVGASRSRGNGDLRNTSPAQGWNGFPVEVRAHSSRQGDRRLRISLVRDITERKWAERRIRRDEAELRQLINFVPEHVLVMEADGTRLYENQAMRDYFGTSLQGIDAKAFFTEARSSR